MSESQPLRGAGRRQAKAARESFGTKARTLVGKLLRNFHEIERLSGKRLSKLALWFVDDVEAPGRLVAVVAPSAIPDSMDSVLAYGLAWQGDADLILVAPSELVGPDSTTMMRLTCVATPVRVFGYNAGDLELSAVPIPTPDEVFAALTMDEDDHRRSFEVSKDDKYQLVEDLTTWADSQAPRLVNRSRPSYRSWHYRGSQVLKVRPTRAGIEIVAGSQKIAGSAGEPTHYEITPDTVLLPILDAVRAGVEIAMEEIHSGMGRPDVEHRLQSGLIPNPDEPSPLTRALGLTYAAREFPAWRGVVGHPTGKPGLIDFLGIDGRDRLHIIETKANADDPKIVLQVLDYAMWVQANVHRIRKHPKFASASDEFPVLDFVCAPKEPGDRAVGPYMAGQLEALSHEQHSWRVWLVEDPDHPVPTSGRTGQMPEGPLVSEPALGERRWAFHVREVLGRARQQPDALLLPDALPHYADLERRHRLHQHIHQKYSSQALCLNLFSDIPESAIILLIKEYLQVSLRRFHGVTFEFEDPDDHLGERRAGHRHQTQIDVILHGETFDRLHWIGLVECKFTEGFSRCSGYLDPSNDDREACRSPGLFGSDPARCFKLKPSPGEQRLYDASLAGVPVSPPQGAANCGGCFVRGEMYQPMRSLALAEALLESRVADLATYALCAPRQHQAAWRRLAELRDLFPDTDRRTVRPLPVESVAMAHLDVGEAFRNFYEDLFERRLVVPSDPDNLDRAYLSLEPTAPQPGDASEEG